jgi:hypothetical protein
MSKGPKTAAYAAMERNGSCAGYAKPGLMFSVAPRAARAIERGQRTPAQEAQALIRKLRQLPEHATRLREEYLRRLRVLAESGTLYL